ncbi:MAG: NTP transferase domain-containing protein [Burkholderiales bacterium]|nr:NTP transferase domain-containing protein [Burkholderiales bacterium]
MTLTPPTLILLGVARGTGATGTRHPLAEPWEGGSVLSATVRNVLASGLPLVVVTTARFSPDVADQVARRDIVELADACAGMPRLGEAVAAGVAARPGPGGWLLLPAHMPMVQPSTLLRVAEALATQSVVYAQHRGRQGHPIGFGAELFSELVRLPADQGPRRLLARFPGQAVEVEDAGVLLDTDTAAGLAGLARLRPSPPSAGLRA